MKTIKYCITNTDISNSFEIDESKCQTYEQLLKSIAANLQIKESQFSIENPPKDKNLNSIDSNYIFKLKINSGCGEITFHLPNGKALNIKEGNKYTFQQIIDYFKTNGICYSQECQNKNLHFKILGKEISKSQFPLKNILPIFVVEVELEGNYITMNYDQKEFIFSENEQSYSAIGFIHSQFEKYTKFENIKIQLKNLNRYLSSAYKLKHDEEYVINIKCPFYFCHTSIAGHQMQQVMDYNSTISDAQNLLPSMLCEDGSIKPKDIVIYDKDKKEIKDGKVLLRNVMDNHFGIPFYFPVSVDYKELIQPNPVSESTQTKSVKIKLDEVPKSEPRKQSAQKNIGLYKPKVTPVLTSNPEFDLKKSHKKHSKSDDDDEKNESKSETKSVEIKFMFDESSEDKFDSYSEKVSTDKTIEELQEEIRQKFNIDKKIIIGYKSGQNLFEIGYDMNIEDVIDDIKTETENVLYIKITQKTKKSLSKQEKHSKSTESKSEKKESNSSNSNDDDNDNENEPKKVDENNNHSDDSYTVYYQTNREDEVKNTELEKGTTVMQFKEMIAEENGVDNLANIKVIFAGKDLLNDIVIDELNVGDIQLYIYIRTEQDIFLMTCKALKINMEEEEEDNNE